MRALFLKRILRCRLARAQDSSISFRRNKANLQLGSYEEIVKEHPEFTEEPQWAAYVAIEDGRYSPHQESEGGH